MKCRSTVKSRGLGRAGFGGFGLAQVFVRPEPAEARPKPWLLGQAGPEHHYC
ncbi:hypothetical protein BYT27DRAFT_7279074 [Phlegmacium glaucopus]|nr:hypothetical protein BYT27DRAFT_7279074 [Phlegmacium glaucopus]